MAPEIMSDVETQAEYLAKIKSCGAEVVVVDFYADWCGPCKVIAPKLGDLEALGNVKVFKVNVDDLEDIARDCGISAMPTFYIYKNGDKVSDLMGANFDKLKELVQTAVNQ